MNLTVDPTSPLPLYYQIREQLRARILSGELKPGDALPGEEEICAQTGVSRMTARQALSQLVSEGLVTRQRGRGTFVSAPKVKLPGIQGLGMGYSELLQQVGASTETRLLQQELTVAGPDTAAALKLRPGEAIVRLIRLRLVGRERMALETSHLPAHFVPGLERLDLNGLSLRRVLEEEYGLSLAYAIDELEISTAGPYEASLLQISEGVPVALVHSINYLTDDTPLLLNHIVHRGDRFRAILRRSHSS
ncbi:MAG: GntR family transcriptional regulator [Anaerolineales bacterium]|nr:GntR family transcriptional regulator [Anaerolineales bacterium]MCX7608572.1 GntR family transcriptional regulator [Anaerolineales bacterium]